VAFSNLGASGTRAGSLAMDSDRAEPLLKLPALAAAPRRARTEHLTTVTTLYRDMDKSWVRAVHLTTVTTLYRDMDKTWVRAVLVPSWRLVRPRHRPRSTPATAGEAGARSVPKPPSRPAE
jgi:hypothetical protein